MLKCHIHGRLAGDPQFAWSTGRDAWQGQGVIECKPLDNAEQSIWRTDVILRFESFENGAGVGPESSLEFSSTAIYTDAPLELTRRFVLSQSAPMPKSSLTLISRSSDCPCRFTVRGDTNDNVLASLAVGSLEIFVPQFSPGQ